MPFTQVSANATIGCLVRQNNRCTSAPSNNKWPLAAIFSSIFFFLAGQPFIALLGVQNDEAIFAGPLFEPLEAVYSWRLGDHTQMPVMLMSYLGCLKTLLYAPILRWFGDSVYAVREPVLLLGAASIWVFYLLLRNIAGDRAASIGCWLLAADSLYLLTTCYDWGPVALQHLLILGGAYAIIRFYQTKSNFALAIGFFLFGLALWDKALALWTLSGLGVAALAVYPRELLGALRPRTILLSAVPLVIGALPLISYNVEKPFVTIRENTVFDTHYLLPKLSYLAQTAKGGILLGFLNADDSATPRPHAPRGWLESASAGISSAFDHPSSSLLLPAFFVALALAAVGGWKAARAVGFFVIAMAVAWVQMAGGANSGASVHHVILLWPWPQAVIAISLAAASFRWKRWGAPAAALTTALVAVSWLLVTNECHAEIVRNGGATQWTAAVFPLAESVSHSGADYVFCTDWGIMESVGLLDKWHPPLRQGAVRASNDPDLEPMVTGESHLFLAHTRQAEFFKDVNENIVAWAGKMGYAKQTVQVVGDGFGRDVFEVYRFVKAGTGKMAADERR